MIAHFFDLDGVVYNYHSHIIVDGMKEFIDTLRKKGHSIIYTTLRGNMKWANHPEFSEEATLNRLKKDGLLLEGDRILFDIPSPRIIYNDEGCWAVNIERDEGIDEWNRRVILDDQ